MKLRDDLIYIKDNKAVPSPYSKTVIEFKDLKTEELGFVYFMCDHRSPFSVYEWEQRILEVKNSIFGNKKWEPVVKLEKYFRTIDLTLMDDNGKPIFHAKDLINNLEKMGKVVDGLTRLEEIVKKEEQAANTNRGGIEVNKYSM